MGVERSEPGAVSPSNRLSVEHSARSGAVFLSYAREDTDAARRIAEALRAFGVEAWFDQSELRGGDTWDAKIRGQIRACTLFLPIVSAQTQARAEGYFRREWKLAVERTNDMAAGVAFIVPVVIDDTPEGEAAVPDEFMRVQWTRLAHGVPTPQFVEQLKRLLEAPRKAAPATRPAHGIGANLDSELSRPTVRDEGVTSPGSGVGRVFRARPIWIVGAVGLVLLGIVGWKLVHRSSDSVPPPEPAARHPASARGDAGRGSAPPAVATPALGEKSIAVLPFANLSTEKENESFADGVHDDIITNLVKIRDLKVISRTSVMAYRTGERNLKKIAADLGVATVLEGSVRRAGSKVKVTAQLIDARTDAHLWAESYDGELTDIFALQAKLAQQIAGALKATLTPGERTAMERRPTQNSEAHDLYLRARAMHLDRGERGAPADFERVIAFYQQAISRDPSFALAHAQVAQVHSVMYWFGFLDPTVARADRMKAAVDAAVRLAPDQPETRIAQGAYYYRVKLDWNRALTEFRAAEAGLPNDAQLSFWLAITLRRLGRLSEALASFERSVALNPRDLASVTNHVNFLPYFRRWTATIDAATKHLAFFPAERELLLDRAGAQFGLDGEREALARATEALPSLPSDPSGLGDRYLAALVRADLAAADRALADSKLALIPGLGSVVDEPVALHRAAVAFLRGDAAAARRFADDAIAFFRNRHWNPRQKAWVRMAVATADAWAGRSAEAIREAEAAIADMTAQDTFGAVVVRPSLGSVYLAAGRRDDALAVLREMLTGPCSLSPNYIRLHPLWSRLKDDPRFEEILKAAKPL